MFSNFSRAFGAHQVGAERGRPATGGGAETLAEEGDTGLGVVLRLQHIEAGVGEQRVHLIRRGQVAVGGRLGPRHGVQQFAARGVEVGGDHHGGSIRVGVGGDRRLGESVGEPPRQRRPGAVGQPGRLRRPRISAVSTVAPCSRGSRPRRCNVAPSRLQETTKERSRRVSSFSSGVTGRAMRAIRCRVAVETLGAVSVQVSSVAGVATRTTGRS